jgi:hypothetical protein
MREPMPNRIAVIVNVSAGADDKTRADKWMLWLASTVGILVFLAATLVAIANGG